MKWIKFSEKMPDENEDFLYYDGTQINLMYVSRNGEIRSPGYYCNDPKCSWNYDDCYCKLIINKEHLWMPLPPKPEDDK